MHIRELSLLNFGRFETQRFVFAPGVNVITGGSGAGKTTVLAAAATALSGVVLRATGDVCRTRDIHRWDVRHTAQFTGGRLRTKDQYPCLVEALTEQGGRKEVLRAMKTASTSVDFTADGRPIGKSKKAAPLVVCYGADRSEAPERRGPRDGYAHWDNASLWEVPVSAWLEGELLDRCHGRDVFDGFDLCHSILAEVFPEAYEGLSLWFEKERVLVQCADGVKPLEELGEAMQSVIRLAADLTRRIEMLAGSRTPDFDEVTGVVMVDDIGRGLTKPRTQRLLAALSACLPQVQFIVTSPDSVGGDFPELALGRSPEDEDRAA